MDSFPHSQPLRNYQASGVVTLVRHFNRPKPEILYFDGDPMNFWSFVRNFESHVDERVDGDAQKLSFLLQHSKGNVRKLIEGCTRMRPQRGYGEAHRQLFEQYGQFYIIAHACVTRAVDGPQVQINDADGLRAFAQCLRGLLFDIELS